MTEHHRDFPWVQTEGPLVLPAQIHHQAAVMPPLQGSRKCSTLCHQGRDICRKGWFVYGCSGNFSRGKWEIMEKKHWNSTYVWTNQSFHGVTTAWFADLSWVTAYTKLRVWSNLRLDITYQPPPKRWTHAECRVSASSRWEQGHHACLIDLAATAHPNSLLWFFWMRLYLKMG